MSIINFTRKRSFFQQPQVVHPGFLCIELLQGLLILGVLLLLVSAYVVLSVHWQHQAIKRFEALNLVSSHLAGVSDGLRSEQKGIIVQSNRRVKMLPELTQLVGSSITVEQHVVTAQWFDERGTAYTVTMVTS